jgi:hypothetical protein
MTVGATFAKAVAETIAIADAESIAATFARTVNEAASLSEVAIGGLFYNADLSETVAATTDEAAATSYTELQISETVAVTEAEEAAVAFVTALVESAEVTIALGALTDYHETRAESLVIVDAETIRLRWEVINDSQPTNWQNVNTAAATNWQTIAT